MCYPIEMAIFSRKTIKETGINAREINGIQEIRQVFQTMFTEIIQIVIGQIEWRGTNNKCNVLKQGLAHHSRDPQHHKTDKRHQDQQGREEGGREEIKK